MTRAVADCISIAVVTRPRARNRVKPLRVPCVFRSGVWAVHPEVMRDRRGNRSFSRTSFVVTHAPTGAAVPGAPRKRRVAIAFAEQLGKRFGDFGARVPFGFPVHLENGGERLKRFMRKELRPMVAVG